MAVTFGYNQRKQSQNLDTARLRSKILEIVIGRSCTDEGGRNEGFNVSCEADLAQVKIRWATKIL